MRDIRTGGGKVFQASGAPVVQADLLGLIIPDSRKALGMALATISLLVLLDVKSLRGTAVLILPLLFSLLWTLGALKVFGILIMPLIIVRKYQPTSQSSIPPDGRENHLFTDMIQTGSHPKRSPSCRT